MKQFLVVWFTMLSFYRRHMLQALFLLVGLVTGVALWAAVQLINDHARASYAEADQLLGAEAKYWIRDAAAQGVPVEDYIRLRRLGFSEIYPVIELRRQTAEGELVSVIATDLLALGGERNEQANNPFAAEAWLPFIQAPYQTWFPEPVATQLGIAEGERLRLNNDIHLPPARIQTQDQQGDRLFMDAGAALATFEIQNFSYLTVGNISSAKAEQLKEALPDGLRLVSNEQALDLAQLTMSLHTNLTALGFLSFVVGMFIVYNAVRFSLVSRFATIDTLRELGVGLSTISMAIAAESVLLSVVGSTAGLWAGLMIGQWMMPAVATSLQSLYGANLTAELAANWQLLPMALLLTLAGVGLALALPLWQTATQSVVTSRNRMLEMTPLQSAVRLSFICGAGLLVIAWLGVEQVKSVEAGFLVIGAVMFGGTLLLPMLIYGVVHLAFLCLPNGALLSRWAVRDALLQLPHLRIALMALLLTLVANIGVTLLIGSFRLALTDWLEVRLSADIFFSGDLKQSDLRRQSWVQSSHTRYSHDIRVLNRPGRLFGVTPGSPDFTDVKFVKSVPGAYDIWRAGNVDDGAVPIIANEQLHFLGGLEPGAQFTLEAQQYQVVGFIHDYGNPEYTLWLPTEVAKAQFPEIRAFGTAIWIEDLGAARQGLIKLGLQPGSWLEQDRLKEISFRIFDRTFAITGVLNSLTLLVAGIALLAALMAVHHSRLVDYGHWRAIGMRWSEWALILGVPLLMMMFCTLLLSIPLGYALSWLLIHQLNVLAFGWTMPLIWDWQPLINLGVITLVIVLVTLALALARTRRSVNLAVRQLSGAQG